MLYQQNGGRIVAIDSVPSLHPMYSKGKKLGLQPTADEPLKSLTAMAMPDPTVTFPTRRQSPIVTERLAMRWVGRSRTCDRTVARLGGGGAPTVVCGRCMKKRRTVKGFSLHKQF